MSVQVINSQERKLTLQSSTFPSDPLDIPLSISQSTSAQTREKFSYSWMGKRVKTGQTSASLALRLPVNAA